ncbi:major facilitator superfamily MFS_1 [Methanococcus vannielii SB]|uniref:Major facilitator superfamily MFS_1 n=1 Tax=Methanococcus vannielii (strain ATCC 35089 / DSM 1224 / JCM 13029 / OCM 148 / SB) TaxID=406327 RepID=A6UR89_METVS|nr:MFS transporter [Methanococcus vannielii]ABR55011.1 major facilitator superfamily MFS_1 [Methanococcus vannielii SB]
MKDDLKGIYAIWITIFVTMLGIGLISPLLAIFAKSYGLTNFQIGLIFGSFSLVRTIFQLPAGKLSDIYGKKIFLVCGTFLYGITTFLYGFASGFASIFIVRTLTGVFSAFVNPVAGSYIVSASPKSKIGEYMGLFNSAISLGFGIGPLLGGLLSDMYGIMVPFYVCGALGIIASIIAYFKVEEISKQNLQKTKLTGKNLFSLEFLKHRNFSAAFMINIAITISRGAILAYLAIYAYDYNVSALGIGLMLAAMNMVLALTQKKFGELYDKSGKFIIVPGIIIGNLGMYVLSFSKSFHEMFISLIIASIGASMTGPAINAVAIKDIPETRKGEAMGLYTISINVGIFLGAVILGYISDIVGISAMYRIGAIFSFLISYIAYIAIKK